MDWGHMLINTVLTAGALLVMLVILVYVGIVVARLVHWWGLWRQRYRDRLQWMADKVEIDKRAAAIQQLDPTVDLVNAKRLAYSHLVRDRALGIVPPRGGKQTKGGD